MPPLEYVVKSASFMSQLKPVSVYGFLSRDSKTLDKESIPYFIKENIVLIAGAGRVLALKLLGMN